jgi:outer membrane protein TolC
MRDRETGGVRPGGGKLVRAGILVLAGASGLGAQEVPAEAVSRAGPATSQAHGMSFSQAFDRVRAENGRVLAASAGVRRARAGGREARGRFLPDVEVTGRHTRIDEAVVLDLSPIRDGMLALHPAVPGAAVPPFEAEVQGETFDRVTVEATLPLFTGGRRLAGVRAARAATRAASAERAEAVGAVTVELTERYFGLRLADEAVSARESTARSLSRHVDRARRLEEQGQIARAERLRAEVAEAEARRALLAAERERSLARLALASTLESEEEVEATTPLFLPGPVESLEWWKTRALEGNPALERAAAGRERAEQGVRAAAGELLPTVGLFGMRELMPGDLTVLEPTWAVGVAVSLPVFEGGRRWHRLEAARALAEEVALRESRGRRDVELLVAQRYRELKEARDRLAELETTRTLAEESLRAQQIAFSAGLATSLDVVDAEAALSRVRLGMLKALYDADVALAGLLEAAGETDRLVEYVESGTESTTEKVGA